MTTALYRKSPVPPYSSGTWAQRMPELPALCHRSRSTIPACSQRSKSGAISSATKRRTDCR